MGRAVAYLLIVAFLVAGCAPRSTGNYALETVGNLGALRGQALSLVNGARRGQELPALRASGVLNAAAQAHAEDMARRGFYGHRSPEGRDLAFRYRANGGGQWSIIAENIGSCIACTPMDGQVRRFQGEWMGSPGHRRNILDPRVREFGFGIASAAGRVYAVQAFVAERE